MITDRHESRLPQGSPAWLRELDLSLPVTAQYLITGNVHDKHVLEGDTRFSTTIDLIRGCLTANDFDLIYRFDTLRGIWLDHVREGVVSNDFFPDSHLNRATVGSVAKLSDLLLRSAAQAERRAGLIIEQSADLWRDHDSLEVGRLMLAGHRLASQDVRRAPGGTRTVPAGNAILWISESDSEAPDWLRHSDSARTLRVPLPPLGVRRTAATLLLPQIDPHGDAAPEVVSAAVEQFADATQGLTLRAMRSIAALAHDQGIGIERIGEVVRSHLAGVVDSPWQDPHLLERIRHADVTISRRVIGQPRAIRRTLDILLRSALGLTGAQQSGGHSRPQGILFFAGPTGVGKTELAKTLAEVLFGAEDAYIRFDMSEFSAEHSEARLIGAPPGYIGHREGGELTNAVRERPFSVLLFDEIEKAHPRILDKFLQILDDGRLTDGSGETVYFSESVIIFTSNLGATAALRQAAGAGSDHERRAARSTEIILDVIRRHFTEQLQRPELLSRMGDNIIVFDPITPDVALKLADRSIAAVVETVGARLEIALDVTDRVVKTLEDYALTKLAFGGRGIGTAIETALVNPLARALALAPRGSTVVLHEAVQSADGWELSAELR